MNQQVLTTNLTTFSNNMTFSWNYLTNTSNVTSSSPLKNQADDRLGKIFSTLIGCLGIIDNAVIIITMATSKKLRTKVRTTCYQDGFNSKN